MTIQMYAGAICLCMKLAVLRGHNVNSKYLVKYNIKIINPKPIWQIMQL